MRLQACIFDLDGVICDTARYHYLAWKALAQELGIPFTSRDNERLKGVSRMDSLEILLELGGRQMPPAEKAALAEKKNALYLSLIKDMTQKDALPGALAFVQAVRAAGVRTALGSVSKNARTILDRLDIAPLFDCIVDGNMVRQAKPDPAVFLAALDGLSADAAASVVFEDAAAGVQAALRAGTKCVGIGLPENLPGAQLVVPDLRAVTLDEVEALL